MTHTSLGLFACGLVLASPSGLSLRHAHSWLAGLATADRSAQVAACTRHHPARRASCLTVAAEEPDELLPDDSVLDDLDSCSPFMAIDGDRELDFDTASGAVTETDDTSGDLRGPARSPAVRAIGTFVTSDQTGRVTMVIGGVRRDYTLVIPADGDQCILALGKANAVDLQQSWFGEISDDPEADAPDYQHVSAPHSQSGFAGPRGHHRRAPRTATSHVSGLLPA